MTARTRTMPKAGSGNVYAYIRVSTAQQSLEGESLDVQRRVCTGYAMQLGLTISKVFTERGISGSRPISDRPEGSKLMATLQPNDIVISPKLDRMFRSALDALAMLQRFKDSHVSLHLIDLGGDVTSNGGNTVSKLVFTILSAVAEAERDRTRERITEVKRDQRLRGRYLGGKAPFGFRVGEAGELIPVPEQQKALARMQRLRRDGYSLREIRNKLRQSGTVISHAAVRLVLRRADRQAAERSPIS
jgi:DNA invertase Pin-like site-specific DNA recombinase